MKTRLNITIEESLLDKIKAYAARQNSSVSQLVEEYFRSITKKPKRKSLLDIIEELPKSKLDFPEDFDFTNEYYQAKEKKYGL